MFAGFYRQYHLRGSQDEASNPSTRMQLSPPTLGFAGMAGSASQAGTSEERATSPQATDAHYDWRPFRRAPSDQPQPGSLLCTESLSADLACLRDCKP